MEKEILCKLKGNFLSDRLKQKSGVPPTVVHLARENFHLIRVHNFHFNRLDRKFWANWKVLLTLRDTQ